MRSAYAEDVYYDDTNVRITNLNIYYAGNSRAVNGVKSARLGIFRPIDDSKKVLIGSAISLLGVIPTIIFFTTGSYSDMSLFTWAVVGMYGLLGIMNVFNSSKSIIHLLTRGEKLPKGEVYGVVLKEQFLEVTTAVSTNREYVETLVTAVQSRIKNKREMPISPFHDPPDTAGNSAIISDGSLIAGSANYRLYEVQSVKQGILNITNSFWASYAQNIAFTGFCLGLVSSRWGLYYIGASGIILMLGLQFVWMSLTRNGLTLAYTLEAKGASGNTIIYASTSKNEVDTLKAAIEQSKKVANK